MGNGNEVFTEMAKFVLAAAGYLVETAIGASAALTLIPVFRPELILMDMQMSVTDGIELTRKLKADPETRPIVVAFTAHASNGHEHGLKATGFHGYIGEPVDVMTRAAEVRFWIEGPDSARRSPFVWP